MTPPILMYSQQCSLSLMRNPDWIQPVCSFAPIPFNPVVSPTGGWVPGARGRVDGQRVGGVQGDAPTAECGHLRQVPARRLHQAQAFVRAGHQRHAQPRNDPRQEDAVGQLLRGPGRLGQHDPLAQPRQRRPLQEEQPLPERPEPGLRRPPGDRHHREPQVRSGRRRWREGQTNEKEMTETSSIEPLLHLAHIDEAKCAARIDRDSATGLAPCFHTPRG